MKLITVLKLVGITFAILWFIDAMVGLQTGHRGFISTYLAPLAFGPLIAASVLRKKELEKDKSRKR